MKMSQFVYLQRHGVNILHFYFVHIRDNLIIVLLIAVDVDNFVLPYKLL